MSDIPSVEPRALRPSRLRSWFAAPIAPERQPEFERELSETNRRRLLALMPLVVIGHAIHIAWFYTPQAKRAQLDPRTLQWHDGIVLAHVATVVPVLLLGALLLARRRAPAPRWLGALATALYLVHGAVVAGIDQYVVTAITPFMGYSLGMVVVLALTPRATLLAYGVGLTAFVAAIATMQPSAAVRLAILPNGISTVVVSIALAWLLYAARRRDFMQRLTIEEQRQALARLNAGLERRVADQVSEIVARAQEVERLNAQLQAQVRERSLELARALAKLAEQHGDDGKLRRGVMLGGRFEIEGVLGEGGMGVVYQGLDHGSGARVAIKVVHAGSSQFDGVHRFLREARAAATVTHPGIVRMLHVDVSDDGTLFQAQELVAGDVLELRLRRGARWDPFVVARLTAALFDALAAAHALGIIHRDVKPGNVMITLGEPGLKLLDFGIAKLYEDGLGDDGRTRTGTILGTPAYMAPEQLVAEQRIQRPRRRLRDRRDPVPVADRQVSVRGEPDAAQPRAQPTRGRPAGRARARTGRTRGARRARCGVLGEGSGRTSGCGRHGAAPRGIRGCERHAVTRTTRAQRRGVRSRARARNQRGDAGGAELSAGVTLRAGLRGAAVLAGRLCGPAFERTVKRLHVGEAEQLRDLAERQIGPRDVADRELTLLIGNLRAEGRAFLVQLTRERAPAHVQMRGDAGRGRARDGELFRHDVAHADTRRCGAWAATRAILASARSAVRASVESEVACGVSRYSASNAKP